jgi:hypothetical protein
MSRMGEGLGGWGHSTRLCLHNSQTLLAVPRLVKLFPAASTTHLATAGIPARARLGRQDDLTAIGKFKITQVDTAAPALDDESGTDREAVRKTHGRCTH